MPKPGITGFKRVMNATQFSWQGLCAAFRNEAAFRQESYLTAILTPIGLIFGKGGMEKALLISVLILVLIVELLNSAVEAAVDRIGDEPHELSGRAKDIGSAAVFLALLNVLVVWILILLF
ncbi:MAG: diacylglycerol kinase [Gammaproteobacteria bacterium]|nr:diacylglycerol kinase [Gammaproteobacteria bacterium]